MNKVFQAARQAVLLVLTFGTLLCSGIYFFGYPDMALGLLVGFIGSAIYFALLWYQLFQNIDAEPTAAVHAIMGGWVERLLTVLIIVGIASFLPGVNLAGVLIGFFVLYFLFLLWGTLYVTKRKARP